MKKKLEEMTNDELIVLGRQQDYERWTYGRYLTDEERDERKKSNDINWRPWHKDEKNQKP